MIRAIGVTWCQERSQCGAAMAWSRLFQDKVILALAIAWGFSQTLAESEVAEARAANEVTADARVGAGRGGRPWKRRRVQDGAGKGACRASRTDFPVFMAERIRSNITRLILDCAG